jgi:hypothetical protein
MGPSAEVGILALSILVLAVILFMHLWSHDG